MKIPPPSREVDARIAPWPGLAAWPLLSAFVGKRPPLGSASGLTLAGQPARILDDARLGLGEPRFSPMGRSAWTARAGGAHPEGRCS